MHLNNQLEQLLFSFFHLLHSDMSGLPAVASAKSAHLLHVLVHPWLHRRLVVHRPGSCFCLAPVLVHHVRHQRNCLHLPAAASVDLLLVLMQVHLVRSKKNHWMKPLARLKHTSQLCTRLSNTSRSSQELLLVNETDQYG